MTAFHPSMTAFHRPLLTMIGKLLQKNHTFNLNLTQTSTTIGQIMNNQTKTSTANSTTQETITVPPSNNALPAIGVTGLCTGLTLGIMIMIIGLQNFQVSLLAGLPSLLYGALICIIAIAWNALLSGFATMVQAQVDIRNATVSKK